VNDANHLNGYRLDRSNNRDSIEARIIVNGVEQIIRGEGEGAMSAFVNGWIRHSGSQINVLDYSEHAVDEGTDSVAAAYVQLNIDGRRIGGAALDKDTVSASLAAVLSAINQAAMRRAEQAA